MINKFEFKGECTGVRLENRAEGDNHICVQIIIGDDGQWIEKVKFSSYWIDELIQSLKIAKEFIETQEPDLNSENRQYGWKFK